jgi:hypothetical protein
MAETIFFAPLFRDIILPFIFIFVLMFAILQKSNILGKNKQTDALISFVIALIVVGFIEPVIIITNLILFLTIAITIILVFMLLYGFASTKGEFEPPLWVKWMFGILIVVSLTIAVLWATGTFRAVYDYIYFSGGLGGVILSNVIFIAVIAIALAIILKSAKSS